MRMLRRILMVVAACLLLLVVAFVLVLKNPVRPRAFDGEIPVRIAEIEQHVNALAGPDEARHFGNLAALEAAADYIRACWVESGFEVHDQPYEVDGTTYRNLHTTYGPNSGPLIVVGAHYDVCGDQPGADDNASAVAALLELSRLLAELRPEVEHRLELVAYTLEEPPFFRTPQMGSAVHAESLARDGVEVRAMICLEMLGYFSDEPGSQEYPIGLLKLLYSTRGDAISVVGSFSDLGLTRAVKSRMAGACAVPVTSINAPASIPGVDFSDHLNYWQHGYSAVMITDTAFYRNPNYHQVTDTPDTLDYERLAEVVKGIYAAVVGL